MRTCLFIISVLAFGFVPLKESIHILQQNRYQLARYRTWLADIGKKRRREAIKTVILFLPMSALCLLHDATLAYRLLLFLLWIYAYLCFRGDMQTAYIKKLVYTHRVKRMLAVHGLLCALMIWILSLVMPWRLFVFCVPLYYFLPWVILLVTSALCEPLETYIKESYVKDAQQILSHHPDLIRIGITGSYGKTSVKHILHALLSQAYYTYMSPHSYNNLMGLTIAIRTQLQALHQIFIAEMGADHVGEIKRLAQFIHPSIAIITAIGPQHLSTFGSQEAIVKEKMQLVEQLPNHGIAILNYDNVYIRTYSIANSCKVITYGIHNEHADVRASEISYSEKGSRFTVTCGEERFIVETCLLGEHNVLNLLAAIACAKALHVETNQIVKAIHRLPYVEHRLQVRKMGDVTLLDDAYNSNPDGAAYALQVLKAMKGKRFLITPGFLDLGKESRQAHIVYAKQMTDCADEIILVGEYQTRDIYAALSENGFSSAHIHVCATMKEALSLLDSMAEKGDCALIENDLPDAFNH